MKIGLYFGTFNPIHIGHLIIANHMAEYSDLDQIWMVVTPHNPHKQKSSLLDDYHRLHMVHLATEDFPNETLAGFVKPPSVDELKRRLKQRSTESDDKINMRIAKAHVELATAPPIVTGKQIGRAHV